MGNGKAAEVLLFGKKITAQEACERNLVTRVFPDAVFRKETEAMIRQYASLPPQVFRCCSCLLYVVLVFFVLFQSSACCSCLLCVVLVLLCVVLALLCGVLAFLLCVVLVLLCAVLVFFVLL